MVPAVTKKSADHYVIFKKVRDMWLSLDNTEVKKANMSGMFRVNLAFYRNINTSKCVDYNIDFDLHYHIRVTFKVGILILNTLYYITKK